MLPCQLFCALRTGDFLMNYIKRRNGDLRYFLRALCWLHCVILIDISRVLKIVTSSLSPEIVNFGHFSKDLTYSRMAPTFTSHTFDSGKSSWASCVCRNNRTESDFVIKKTAFVWLSMKELKTEAWSQRPRDQLSSVQKALQMLWQRHQCWPRLKLCLWQFLSAQTDKWNKSKRIKASRTRPSCPSGTHPNKDTGFEPIFFLCLRH